MTDVIAQVLAWANGVLGSFPIPGWVAAVLAGLAFGLNAGSWVTKRRMLRLFDLEQYDDEALLELIGWADEILSAREASRAAGAKDEKDDVVSCECPQNPGVDVHEDQKNEALAVDGHHDGDSCNGNHDRATDSEKECS